MFQNESTHGNRNALACVVTATAHAQGAQGHGGRGQQEHARPGLPPRPHTAPSSSFTFPWGDGWGHVRLPTQTATGVSHLAPLGRLGGGGGRRALGPHIKHTHTHTHTVAEELNKEIAKSPSSHVKEVHQCVLGRGWPVAVAWTGHRAEASPSRSSPLIQIFPENLSLLGAQE